MGNALGLEPSPEQLESEALQEDMKFYCSYCMLCNKQPTTVVLEKSKHCVVLENNDLSRKHMGEVSVTLSGSLFKTTILLLSNINPYVLADTLTCSYSKGIDNYSSLFGDPIIEETSDYVVHKVPMIGGSTLTLQVYKHVAETLSMSLVSIPKYSDQIGTNAEGYTVSTICREAELNTQSMAPPLKRLLGMKGDTTLHYTLRDGATIHSISNDAIAQQIADLAEKEIGQLNDQQRLNLCERIRRIHTPLVKVDPYTRHGSTPTEYRRIWSFIHCCRGKLPPCQFQELVRGILEVFFLLAERNIESYSVWKNTEPDTSSSSSTEDTSSTSDSSF